MAEPPLSLSRDGPDQFRNIPAIRILLMMTATFEPKKWKIIREWKSR
jgi:hypothetical protein